MNYEELASPEGADWKRRLMELRGRRLICWCKPKPCHGDILVKLMREFS